MHTHSKRRNIKDGEKSAWTKRGENTMKTGNM